MMVFLIAATSVVLTGAQCEELFGDDFKITEIETVFNQMSQVPLARDEFETSEAFRIRSEAVSRKIPSHYFLKVPIDSKYVKYDADQQLFEIIEYGLDNVSMSSDGIQSIFGYGSSLREAGVEVGHGSRNITLDFPRSEQFLGSYEASNSFGVSVTVSKYSKQAYGVFEREVDFSGGESLWQSPRKDSYGSYPLIKPIFRISSPPGEARKLKENLYGVFAVVPNYPYHTTGTGYFKPTINVPREITTHFKYVFADIKCVAIFNLDGDLLASRPTR